ncbi:hypothetical protein [Litoribacillus peritrichatus]|uniref:Uncharacterized protein n=1 Tax=Litoribacillus peritrichatus TaxID=718191 RepID=A0ABP7MH23_9GAMM
MKKTMFKNTLSVAISAAVLSSAVLSSAVQAQAQVDVLDKTHYPADNFLAYTEFELSGEPLAEALGLDLDVLDPDQVNYPTLFDYAAGIESYEYSEEAMFALNYQSGMGPNLVNGPVNEMRGGTPEKLQQRLKSLADAVGMDQARIKSNMYLISMPYVSGSPEFGQAPDISTEQGGRVELFTFKDEAKIVQTLKPGYKTDFSTLRWSAASFDKTFNPAATGGILLKEVMWAQDFLGGMHVTESDEEVEAASSVMDQDGKHSLGVSATDGFNGMMLTELSVDKLLIMQRTMGFDGKTLGVAFGPDYNPKNGAVWFPHRLAVKEGQKHNVTSIKALKVTDGSSSLRDTWQMLWPLAELFAMTDQRDANTAQNPAFRAVFDGAPFAAAPKANIDDSLTNDVVADDAFSLANNLSNLVFKNLEALHFNEQAGTFVTEYALNEKGKGVQGNQVSTFDANYSMVALSIYQRAKDALPVGYASAEGGDVNLQSAEGKTALKLITRQADFIINHLINKQGLVVDGATLKGTGNFELVSNTSLDAQFSTIRGLVAAFLATKDAKYQQAARNIYLAVEKHMFDKSIETWAQTPGKATIHTPHTAAAISGGLREAMLHLKNEEGENHPSLELETLTHRYERWFRTVINGGMQMAEALGDSGEHVVKGQKDADNDQDGVPQVTAAGGPFGTSQVMAAKVRVK